jgi:hypothetical protein
MEVKRPAELSPKLNECFSGHKSSRPGRSNIYKAYF